MYRVECKTRIDILPRRFIFKTSGQQLWALLFQDICTISVVLLLVTLNFYSETNYTRANLDLVLTPRYRTLDRGTYS